MSINQESWVDIGSIGRWPDAHRVVMCRESDGHMLSYEVAQVFEHHHTEEARENAKQRANLIAKAPKLLAAAKCVDEWHDLIRQNYPEMYRHFAHLRETIEEAEGI